MKNRFDTIDVAAEGRAAIVTIARPDVRNAFDDRVISELAEAFSELDRREEVRVVKITGRGKAFSAGADLNWMKRVAGYDFERNLSDAMGLADTLEILYTMGKPTIALVNGPAIGGGVGLVAACDVAIASEEAFFSLSEVRLGLVPSCIAPYVLRRIGERYAREYFLTGKRFDAGRALEIGLVNSVVPAGSLSEEGRKWERDFLRCGPDAIASCKRLIAECSERGLSDLKEFTARMIAELRVSSEGQEGMNSFFEKRKPSWDEEGDG